MNIPTSKKIAEMAKAGYPALFLVTSEDSRARLEISEAAKACKREMYVWTLGTGVVKEGSKSAAIPDTGNPTELLEWLPKMSKESIIVLRLFHHFLEDPLVQSRFLELLPNYKNATQRMVIIMSPVVKIPTELEKEIALVDLPLPDKGAIETALDGIVKGSGLTGDRVPQGDLRKQLISNASGMTTGEAESALALALIRGKAAGKPWDPDVVMDEKAAALRKTGLLEYIHTQSYSMGGVGGMQALKEWAKKRRRSWTPEAKQFGLDEPKGMLIVGIPGTGKSLVSKSLSREWGLPLLRLDMGRIFGSLVGQSEANIRMAIQVAEAIAPCILWVDEFEKGLAGSGAGQGGDGGTSSRVLGTLLTWMQDKTSEVFVCATANDVTALPPELLRAGRFDAMFGVLLPTEEERKEIFTIHLRKRKRDSLIGGVLNLDQLASRAEDFSGAEIEEAVKEALVAAFDQQRELSQMDLVNAIDSIKPLSKTMPEKIQRMVSWVRDRARPANGENMLELATPPAVPTGDRMVQA